MIDVSKNGQPARDAIDDGLERLAENQHRQPIEAPPNAADDRADDTLEGWGPPSNEHKLTDELRAYVVQRLAAFDRPGEIARALRRECGITIHPKNISAYNPTVFAGRRLAPRWKALFESTRARVLADDASLGDTMTRVHRLDGLARRAIQDGDLILAAQLQRQSAREIAATQLNPQGRAQALRPTGPQAGRPLSDAERLRALATLVNKVLAADGHDVEALAPEELLPMHGDPNGSACR